SGALDVPRGTGAQRVAGGGQPGEVGHGGAGGEAAAGGGREREYGQGPPEPDLLEGGGHRGGDAEARVLVPGAGQPVRGEGGRERAAVDEAEVASAGVHNRGRRADFVEQRHHRAGIARSLRQRPAEIPEALDRCRRGRHAPPAEGVEIAGGTLSGGAQQVVHGGRLLGWRGVGGRYDGSSRRAGAGKEPIPGLACAYSKSSTSPTTHGTPAVAPLA